MVLRPSDLSKPMPLSMTPRFRDRRTRGVVAFTTVACSQIAIPGESQTMRHLTIIFLAAFVVIGALTGWFRGWLGPRPPLMQQGQLPPDWIGAQRTVSVYLQALERRDRNLLLGTILPGNDATTDIDDRLRQFGGARATQADIRMSSDLSPRAISVAIRTVGSDSQPLAWTENLFWRDGVWHLILGSATRTDLFDPPSSIDRP